MSTGNRRRRGYSLIEALVAVAVTGIGVSAALGGMGALARGERRALITETMQRLAFQKYEEIVATGEVTSATLEGDFSDRNLETLKWEAEVEQSGTENLSIITVRVTSDADENMQAQARGLLFEPPPPLEEGGAQ